MESVVDANELCDRVGGIVKATDLTYGASGRLRGKRCSDLGVRDEQAGKQKKFESRECGILDVHAIYRFRMSGT